MKHNEYLLKFAEEWDGIPKFKIKDYVCKCGCDEFYGMASYIDKKGGMMVHNGLYCSKCGKWLKWASKDEVKFMWECVRESHCCKCGRFNAQKYECAKQHYCPYSPVAQQESRW